MADLLLGVDIGTSNAKAVLADPDGNIVAEAQSGYETQFPRSGWAEQDPSDWWGGLVHAVRQIMEESSVSPAAIAGIAISGQGCAVTLIDHTGGVIRPAIIWRDSRSEPQCEVMRQHAAEEVLQRNGKSPGPYNADPTLMWLQANEPESIQRAQVSLTTTSYITYRLTNEPVMNVSDASILFAFDLTTNTWAPSLIEAFGLPERLYPRVVPCTDVVGTLTKAAASDLGLSPGIPIVAGGEDTSSAGLAIGVTQPGETLLSLGTASTMYIVQDGPHIHPALLAFAHVLPNQVLLGGSMVAGGGILDWCQQIYGADLSFSDLTQIAAQSTPGANNVLFLPYLSGELQPINDGNARGVYFGLSTSTTQADMVRAAMEGMAYAIAHNIDIAAKVGTPITEIRAVGGPTRSALWCQMIADVSGYP
ncbi:MAG: FGGY family carbohydrate kinase, partial [Chloroflexota bacterium]